MKIITVRFIGDDDNVEPLSQRIGEAYAEYGLPLLDSTVTDATAADVQLARGIGLIPE